MYDIPPTDNRLTRRVADAIRATREAAGLTKEDFAARLNKDAAWVTALEDGSRHIWIHELPEIAAALGLDALELLNRTMRRGLQNQGEATMNEIPETIDGVNLGRLYRLTIDPPDASGHMRVAFIEADDEAQARETTTNVVALIDRITIRQAGVLVCNVRTAGSLVGEGFSDDLLHRLFEVRGTLVYDNPIFLLSKPGPLTKKWVERVAIGTRPDRSVP